MDGDIMDSNASEITLSWTEMRVYIDANSILPASLVYAKVVLKYYVKLQIPGWVLYSTIDITDPPNEEQINFEEFVGI
jgi:hypothetical protein